MSQQNLPNVSVRATFGKTTHGETRREKKETTTNDGAVDLTFEQDLMHLIKKKNIFYIFDVAAGSEKKFCFYT